MGTQRDLYSTCLCWGFTLGVIQILGFTLGDNANFKVRVGSARLFRYQHVGIPNRKFSRWGFAKGFCIAGEYGLEKKIKL